MSTVVTHLIGKRSLNGSWIIDPPVVTPIIAEKLAALPHSTALVNVRIRPVIASPETQVASEVRTMAGRMIDEVRNTGSVRVVMERGGRLRGSSVHGGHVIQTFEVGKVYQLGVLSALRLLNADPMRYIFEEVDSSGSVEAARPITNTQDAIMRELQEQLRSLTDRLAVAEARALAPQPKKRTLKDALGDADGQE